MATGETIAEKSPSGFLERVFYRPNFLPAIIPVFIFTIFLSYYARDYVMDDAYIGFRYVNNLIAGNGFVFNPPDRVEGITNIGWLLFLVPWSFFIRVHIASKIFGALLVVLTTIISYVIAVRMTGDKSDYIFALPVPICIATESAFIYFSLAGMETAFLSTLLCLIVFLVLTEKSWSLVAALSSFCYLVHPECVLIFPLAFAFGLLLDRERMRRQFVSVAVYILLIAGYTLLRFGYYHDFLPNTYYAKFPSAFAMFRNIHDYIGHSSIVNIPGIFSGLTGLFFLAAGAVFCWRISRPAAIFMSSVTAVGIVFSLYAWSDWTTFARYFAPYVPVAFILFWKAAGEFVKAVIPGPGYEIKYATVTALITVLIVISGFADLYRSIRSGVVDEYPWNVMTGKNLVAPAKWVEENVPDGSVIATRRIGALSYYTTRNIFDYKYGLTEKDIARLARQYGRAFEYPDDPAIDAIWKQKAPDYVFEDLPRLQQIAERSNGTLERFSLHSIEYRAIRTFTIGNGLYWVLCGRI